MLAWLAALALLISFRMLRGDIRTSGFLSTSSAGAGIEIAPERVVAMVAFPAVLLMYVMTALNTDLTAINGRPVMPDVPEFLLTLLTGGNGLYLAGKIARRT
jgi:hypothetical protein